MNLQEILFENRKKIIVTSDGGSSSKAVVATLNKKLQRAGFTLSKDALEALMNTSQEQVLAKWEEVKDLIRSAKGSHVAYNVLYPNFPEEVMEMEEAELYLNAFYHYFTVFLNENFNADLDTYLHDRTPKERQLLSVVTRLDVIGLGSEEEALKIYTSLAGSNSSLSDKEKEQLVWFAQNCDPSLLPETIPQKETIAILANHLDEKHISGFIKSPTDVLRIATVMCGGDVSLAENCKFKLKRGQRRKLLAFLENCNDFRDLTRHRNKWIKLAEALHPGEFKKKFPKSFESITQLRNKKLKSFNSIVEKTIADNTFDWNIIQSNPGDFARRLDHILRTKPEQETIDKFVEVAHKISTPVLLQIRTHFATRAKRKFRAFMPKGSVAKMQVFGNDLKRIKSNLRKGVVESVDQVLIDRFKKQKPLGKTFIDPSLKKILLPSAKRSASKSLKTLTRGSRYPLSNENFIRFFVWWKNTPTQRVDIDLSVMFLSEDFKSCSRVSYYELRNGSAYHSGDITDAPNGASEFIDLKLDDCEYRYVVMTLHSYTSVPFNEMTDLFAGWMMRSDVKSGEIYEPTTVDNKFDLTSNTTVGVPMVLDVLEKEMIWMDLSTSGRYINNVDNSKSTLVKYIQSMQTPNKMNLYDLFKLHAQARGEIVKSKGKADTVFSLNEGITPYQDDIILSEFCV